MATIDRYKLKVDVDGADQVKNLDKNLVDLDKSLATAQRRLTQFGAAGLAALTALGVSAIRTAKNMSDLAGTAGFTAGEIFQMSVAAEQAGGSFDQVGTMLLRFSSSIETAVDGSDKMRRSLERVGVSAQELETLDDQQLFRRVVQGLGAMEDGAEKTALSIQLLGRQAATTDLRQFGESLNQAVDPALERRLENAAQAVRNIGAAFRELQMAALAAMNPIIEQLNKFTFDADAAQKTIQILGALTAAAFSAATVLAITRTIRAIRALAVTIRAAATAQALLTGLIPVVGAATVLAAVGGATLAYNALGKAIGDTADQQKELNDLISDAAPGGPAAPTGAVRDLQQTAEQRREQAVRRTTQQLEEQNRLSNEYRRTLLDTIGQESSRASLLRANLDAEREANQRILQLQNDINDEKAKGSQANELIIAHLELQQELVKGQLVQSQLLNHEEFERLRLVRLQAVQQELAIEKQSVEHDLGRQLVEQDILRQRIRGEINEEEMRFLNQVSQETVDFLQRRARLEEQLQLAKSQGDAEEAQRIKGLMSLDEERFENRVDHLRTLRELEQELNQSFVAGTVSAMEQISKQFEPYQMAQDAILQGWNRIGSAIDNFVETGKFKFSEFARSVLQDLLKMIIRAQVFQAISGAMGFFGIGSIPGLAKGGPAAANQPYIVGEQGPELFVPRSAGTVIPNDRLMGGQQSVPSATMQQPSVNNYITNNISALDSKSVAQVFAENRQALLGTVQVAQREQPF